MLVDPAGDILVVVALHQRGDAAGDLDVLDAAAQLGLGLGQRLAALLGDRAGDVLIAALPAGFSAGTWYWMRSVGGVRRQLSKAAWAACTAASTSSRGVIGTRTSVSAVAGLRTSRNSVARELVHAPSM